jgi:hypothetical protein
MAEREGTMNWQTDEEDGSGWNGLAPTAEEKRAEKSAKTAEGKLKSVLSLLEVLEDWYDDDYEDDRLECPTCGKLFVNDGGGLYCSADCEEAVDA